MSRNRVGGVPWPAKLGVAVASILILIAGIMLGRVITGESPSSNATLALLVFGIAVVIIAPSGYFIGRALQERREDVP